MYTVPFKTHPKTKKCFSHVQLFVTPWTIAHHAPLSMGILQARTLEWVAMPSCRGSPDPGIKPVSPALAGRFFTTELPGKPQVNVVVHVPNR